MSITYSLGITSATEVELIPEWDYKNGDTMDYSRYRTASGRLYQYKWHDYKVINFSTKFVNSSTASIVNSWWTTQTKLLFFVNNAGTVDVTSVFIVNKNAPFRENVKPYTEYWQGTIELEEYM